MPVISIIVPVYNSEIYLRKCIDSILAQTFSNFECILINDGSIDSSPMICNEYAMIDNRIIVIHQENAGVSAARNSGLGIANGEWIGFVDSDDWCDPEMFYTLYENAMKYDADISVCGIRYVFQDRRKTAERIQKKIQIFNGEEATLKIFTSAFFGGFSVNKLAKKKYFSQYNFRYDSRIKYMEDVMLFYEIFKYTEKIVYFSKSFYNYFINLGSVTEQYGLTEAAKTGFIVFDKMISLENCAKIKRVLTLEKIFFASKLCHEYIIQKDHFNENFCILKKIILDSKICLRNSLFDFSIPLKRKAIFYLTFSPNLYYWVYHTLKKVKVFMSNKAII